MTDEWGDPSRHFFRVKQGRSVLAPSLLAYDGPEMEKPVGGAGQSSLPRLSFGRTWRHPGKSPQATALERIKFLRREWRLDHVPLQQNRQLAQVGQIAI